MLYTVKSSDKLWKSGANAETKALLYLMNFRSDSNDIYYFVVDFFNFFCYTEKREVLYDGGRN